MSKKEKAVRKSVQLNKELAEWIEENAKYLGISESAFMVMIFMDYMRNAGR
jgi:hypothetical protein